MGLPMSLSYDFDQRGHLVPESSLLKLAKPKPAVPELRLVASPPPKPAPLPAPLAPPPTPADLTLERSATTS
jgi:ribonucleoside-diphosphate reductase alpha chain